MTELQELLFAASAAAAQCKSPAHRAAACRTMDRLGLEWSRGLPTETVLLAEAIAASIRALAGATTDGTRAAIAAAIDKLIAACRARRVEHQQIKPAPRMWWLEYDMEA